MNQPTLIEATQMMEEINKSEDYNAYFSAGKFIVEEKIIKFGRLQNGKFERNCTSL